jgi:hypothetical protein
MQYFDNLTESILAFFGFILFFIIPGGITIYNSILECNWIELAIYTPIFLLGCFGLYLATVSIKEK